ncbi:GNAT family N-acetyltransferase [Paenibacillus eucommiae]|uniref:GNAT superfamily N-acetyltransferase n=1 Tax=Paenibacillus eucommiae TaxID=1355755 RepID=A0ABS4IX97_9BACL|nr:GNAT family N-acetyltransferase [Paenibacillus eucommiae]MBP1992210.1 GNAT superfamily N-acetyltransferase [Paenibacillus eucommiae]
MGNTSDTFDILIRDAQALDQDVVHQLILEAYQQYEAVLPAELWDKYKESIGTAVYGEGPEARIIAIIKDEIVGSVLIFRSSDIAYGQPGIDSPIIRLLAVSPKARGKGVATELIKESVRRTIAWGAATLHLHTSDMMESAVRLYERLGFERAYDKDLQNGNTLVKSYWLRLSETAILNNQDDYIAGRN